MVWVAFAVLWFMSGHFDPASATASDGLTEPAERLVAVRRGSRPVDAPPDQSRRDEPVMDGEQEESADGEDRDESSDESPSFFGSAI